MNDKENKTEKTDINDKKDKNENEAVQKYGILMSYLQYENSSFWDRNNFFIIANTALLGFLIQKLPEICSQTSWENIIIPFVYSIAGLLLSILWRLGLKKSEKWIDHWIKLLKKKEIEENAWGKDFHVFEGNGNKSIGAIKNAYHVVCLFFAFWIILILYIIIFAILGGYQGNYP